jgi:hypothetical protein
MAETFILSIGYIPKDWSGERISCGDPDGSNLKEITVSISDTSIEIENETFPLVHKELWSPKSNLWKLVAEKASDILCDGEASITSAKLFKSWQYFQDEGNLPAKAKVIFGEEDCGEFDNSDSELNDYFYIRFQVEELIDDEASYYGERGIAIK